MRPRVTAQAPSKGVVAPGALPERFGGEPPSRELVEKRSAFQKYVVLRAHGASPRVPNPTRAQRTAAWLREAHGPHAPERHLWAHGHPQREMGFGP